MFAGFRRGRRPLGYQGTCNPNPRRLGWGGTVLMLAKLSFWRKLPREAHAERAPVFSPIREKISRPLSSIVVEIRLRDAICHTAPCDIFSAIWSSVRLPQLAGRRAFIGKSMVLGERG